MKNKKNKKRAALAIVLGVVTFGVVAASAASLGGLSGASLGAEDVSVTGCDANGVTVAYTSAFTTGTYKVTAVTLSGVDAACTGKALKLTLRDSANVSLAEVTGVAALSNLLTLTTPVSASAVAGVSVVISG